MRGKNPTPRNSIGDWWYGRDQRMKLALLLVAGLLLIAVCIGAGTVIGRALRSRQEAAPTPVATAPPTTAPTAPTGPTTAPTRAPTATPAPTETLLPTPTPEPTPVPSANDSQGDVTGYDSGEPVETVPAGVDVRAASVRPDLRVALQPAEGVPAELAQWAAADEGLLWITLYEPIPDPPADTRDWLFALDLDGNAETGRPVGSARINPDLGMEVALGLFYNPATEQFSTYSLVWDTEQGNWAAGPAVRYYLSDARTLIGLAVPLAPLGDAVAQTAGVTVVPEAVVGRAAALAGAGEERVIDFCPDLPD